MYQLTDLKHICGILQYEFECPISSLVMVEHLCYCPLAYHGDWGVSLGVLHNLTNILIASKLGNLVIHILQILQVSSQVSVHREGIKPSSKDGDQVQDIFDYICVCQI